MSGRTTSADARDAARFLLFDLGGVLVENAGFDRLGALLPVPLDTGEIKARWLASEAVRAFESGRIEADEFVRRLIDEWMLRIEPEALIADFAGWPRGFFPGANALLDSLRATHRIGCLTNSNALHWARFDGFAGRFDICLSSHLTGLVKPDAACFEHAVAACGVPPYRIAYFDDAAANVVAARHAGLDAWHVEGIDALRDALGRLRASDAMAEKAEWRPALPIIGPP